MTFIHDIELDFSRGPICDAMGVYIIEFSLGYHLEQEQAEIMSVMLVPGASYLRRKIQNVYDLKFGIRTRCLRHTWKVGDPDFGTEASRRCIRSQDRTVVLSCVVDASRSLIQHVRPSHITMATYDRHLRGRALEKFETIVREICALGYDLMDNFLGEDGTRYWYIKAAGSG